MSVKNAIKTPIKKCQPKMGSKSTTDKETPKFISPHFIHLSRPEWPNHTVCSDPNQVRWGCVTGVWTTTINLRQLLMGHNGQFGQSARKLQTHFGQQDKFLDPDDLQTWILSPNQPWPSMYKMDSSKTNRKSPSTLPIAYAYCLCLWPRSF